MLKRLISLCLAFVSAFLLVNGTLFLYERPVGWVDTPNGPSTAVRKPHALLIHGTEGYSVTQIDSYGFTNEDYPLADEYILMMGASHSQGKEMGCEYRYSSIVNQALVGSNKQLAAFNIACDGHFLPSLIKHFQAAIETYPGARCITLEIGSTDYSTEALTQAVKQLEIVDTRSAEEIFSQLSPFSKVKNLIKEYIPLLSMIKTHLETAPKGSASGKQFCFDEREYRAVVTDALKLIRSQYDGPIVFVYHPNVKINADGSVSIIRSQTIDIFKEVCADTGIDMIDVGDAFLEHYDQYRELPYGFANTTPGNGHLNKVGHQIMADAILEYLGEVGCK